MSPTGQFGMHPDAEVLTAFAEQLVTDAEREQVLAHIATCGRCREVVFLTHRMVEAEEPGPGAAVSVPKEKSGLAWFAGWRWAWVPVAALAGVVGVAVIQHSRHAATPTKQMAQNGPLPEQPLSTVAIKADEAPKTSSEPSRVEPSGLGPKQKSAAPRRTDRDEELDRKSVADKDEFAEQKKDEYAKKTDSLREIAPQEQVGNLHGALQARAKSSAIGGPMAQNQVQQQSNSQMQQQNYANEAGQGNVLADSTNKPAAPTIPPGTVSQTVTVEAPGGAVPVSPALSAAPVVSAVQMETETAELSQQELRKAKAGASVLPSKLGVLSQTRAGRTLVAIDTAGSVFVSDDAGKHWQSVHPRWSGRPVLVKPRSMQAATGGLLKQAAPRFELTIDTHEIWVSEDGKSWTLEPLTTR